MFRGRASKMDAQRMLLAQRRRCVVVVAVGRVLICWVVGWRPLGPAGSAAVIGPYLRCFLQRTGAK